jgi:hypothetical protein
MYTPSTTEDTMTRENTNLVLEMIEEGALDKMDVIRALLMWLPDREVAELAEKNEWINGDAEADVDESMYGDESMDGDHDSAMASVGWGADEDYGGWEDIEY